MRFPSLPNPPSSNGAAAVLEEIIRDIWEAFPELEPENRFFAAGGRAGIPAVRDFPVAAARTAEAVTGLFWLDDATNMFFPLDVTAEDVSRGPTFSAATTADRVGACVAPPVGMMLMVAGIDTADTGTDDDEDDEEEEEEETGFLLAVLCFGSICRMSTSGSLISVAIRVWACLVASSEPLIVIDRSP